MKTEPVAKRAMTTAEITARVCKLKSRFFDGISPGDLSIILRSARPMRFQAHSVITNEGDRADKLFLIIEGYARAFLTTPKGEKIVLFWIPPGDVSGARAMLSKPTDYLMSMEAVTDALALGWTRSDILSLSKQHRLLLENALNIASDYLEVWRDLHLEASYHTATQRVARVLGSFAKGMGRKVAEGIELNVTNEELANEANVTIFTVSRLLSAWHRKGLIVKGRGKVVVHSPDELVSRFGWR
jgi:CRP/FNR family transcriptional regulator, nitrogen oxide reductase regulator